MGARPSLFIAAFPGLSPVPGTEQHSVNIYQMDEWLNKQREWEITGFDGRRKNKQKKSQCFSQTGRDYRWRQRGEGRGTIELEKAPQKSLKESLPISGPTHPLPIMCRIKFYISLSLSSWHRPFLNSYWKTQWHYLHGTVIMALTPPLDSCFTSLWTQENFTMTEECDKLHSSPDSANT